MKLKYRIMCACMHYLLCVCVCACIDLWRVCVIAAILSYASVHSLLLDDDSC